MKQIVIFSFLAFGSLINPNWAEDCYNKAVSQYELNQCAGSHLKAQDDELNRNYQRILKETVDDPKLKMEIIKSQRAWIKYRYIWCGLRRLGGGSVVPMVVTECAAQMTEERVKQLKEALDCKEGDVSCILPHHN